VEFFFSNKVFDVGSGLTLSTCKRHASFL